MSKYAYIFKKKSCHHHLLLQELITSELFHLESKITNSAFFLSRGFNALRTKRPNVSHSKNWLLIDGQAPKELSEDCDGPAER